MEENEKQGAEKKSFHLVGMIFKGIGILSILVVLFFLLRAIIFKKYDIFGYKFYVILSGSMSPTIETGDVAIISERQEVKNGDIIAYVDGNMTTIHRVIGINNINNSISYQTKGDNNNVADIQSVLPSDVQGVFVKRIPKIGKIFFFIRDNLIIIVGIGIVLLFFIAVRRLICNGKSE